MKIEKLNNQQINQLDLYKEKWLKIGLCTDRVDKKIVNKTINFYYEKILNKKSVPVVVLASPLQTWIGVIGAQTRPQVVNKVRAQVVDQVVKKAVVQVVDKVRAQVVDQVVDQVVNTVVDKVRAQVMDQVGDTVRAKVMDKVMAQVGAQAGAKVGHQVVAQVMAKVVAQVWAQVGEVVAQVGAQAVDQVGDFCWPHLDGHFSSAYFSFYDFFENILDIKLSEKWEWHKGTAQMGLIYPLENICFVSDRPAKICLKNKRLHKDGAPAIEYSDNFSVWALNGIRVTKEIAETPADLLDSKLILKEKNVEIRREIVRKIGIERICKDLSAKCIDKWNEYELLELDLKDGRKRPYLKMVNPSIGVYHIEGVHPECKTVEQALVFRNGTLLKPTILT